MKTKQEVLEEYESTIGDTEVDPDYYGGLSVGFDLGAQWALDNLKQILLDEIDKIHRKDL